MAKRQRSQPPTDPVDLRIIGGYYRGTKLASEPILQTTGATAGQLVTRPMKHRVREAIFNLVGLEAKAKHAIDVFAGTGALGLEALSRGAKSATFIERHVPTAAIVRRNIATVGVEDRCELLIASAFVWCERDLLKGNWTGPAADAEEGPQPDACQAATARRPWLVFISPPYAFFLEREAAMLSLIGTLIDHAPHDSMVVVEADDRFDFSRLPGQVKQHRSESGWDVRPYSPAVVGVWRVASAHSS